VSIPRRAALLLSFGLLSCGGGAGGPVVPVEDQPGFQIEIVYVGTAPSAAIAQSFTSAASRIQSIITGDLQSVRIGSTATPFQVSACVSPSNTFDDAAPVNEVFDDLVIFVKVDSIDGVGQVLGSAGPCLTRTTTGHTALGVMRFDSADLQNLANNGRLGAVVLHEMLHVVGVGTLWQSKGILVDTSTATVRVTGPLAVAACVTDHGGAAVCTGNAVPAENCLNLSPSVTCGVGTRNSHWKESIFQTELMTGYAGASNPLSKMTIQNLADMGYTVNTGAADAYTVPSVAAMRELRVEESESAVAMPEPMRPRFSVDAAGFVRRLPR
jgi:Leishmanolysin